LPGSHGDRRNTIKREWGKPAAATYVDLKSASDAWRYYARRPTIVDTAEAWNLLNRLLFVLKEEIPGPS
jgi:hypothetical protein